jgi:hypothetical protein
MSMVKYTPMLINSYIGGPNNGLVQYSTSVDIKCSGFLSTHSVSELVFKWSSLVYDKKSGFWMV